MSFRLLSTNDYQQYYPLINSFRTTSFTEEQFKTFVNTLPSNMEIWVLEKNSVLVATGTLIFEPKLIFDLSTYAHVEDVCVLPSERNHKYGSTIVQQLIKRANEKQCHKITLVCAPSTAPFYIKNGLEERGVQCCQLLDRGLNHSSTHS
jgi:hypothetical protein